MTLSWKINEIFDILLHIIKFLKHSNEHSLQYEKNRSNPDVRTRGILKRESKCRNQ